MELKLSRNTVQELLHLMKIFFARQSNWVSRIKLVSYLESIQDLIVISLCIGLFCFMVIQLQSMFMSLIPPLDLQVVTSDILFLLILVELFRLLIIYLREKRVSIPVTVEVSIVSVLREVIVHEVLAIPWFQVLATCVFLITLAFLLLVQKWLSPATEQQDLDSLRSQLHASYKQQSGQF